MNTNLKLLTIATLATIAVTSTQASASTSYVMCHMHSFSAAHSGSEARAVSSDHQVQITNTSNVVKEYQVEYQTRIDKIPMHHVNYKVTINPGVTYTDNRQIDVNRIFKDKKSHDASCGTWIDEVGGKDKTYIMGGGYINII